MRCKFGATSERWAVSDGQWAYSRYPNQEDHSTQAVKAKENRRDRPSALAADASKVAKVANFCTSGLGDLAVQFLTSKDAK